MPAKPLPGTTLAADFVLRAAAGTFFAAFFEVDPGLADGTYYVLLYNGTAAAADSSSPQLITSYAVDHKSGTRDYVKLEAGVEAGVRSTVGIVASLSTTRPAKTSAGAHLWLQTALVGP